MKRLLFSLFFACTTFSAVSGQNSQAIMDSTIARYSKMEVLNSSFTYSSIKNEKPAGRYKVDFTFYRDGRVHFYHRTADDAFVASYIIEASDTVGEFYGRMIDTTMELIERFQILSDIGGIAGAGMGHQSKLFYHSKFRLRPEYILGETRDTIIQSNPYFILPITEIHTLTTEEQDARIKKNMEMQTLRPDIPFPNIPPPNSTKLTKYYVIDISNFVITYILSSFQIDDKEALRHILKYKNEIDIRNPEETWAAIKANFRIN